MIQINTLHFRINLSGYRFFSFSSKYSNTVTIFFSFQDFAKILLWGPVCLVHSTKYYSKSIILIHHENCVKYYSINLPLWIFLKSLTFWYRSFWNNHNQVKLKNHLRVFSINPIKSIKNPFGYNSPASKLYHRKNFMLSAVCCAGTILL